LIGSYLLKLFLEKDHVIYALSKRKNGKNARERIVELLNFWNGKGSIAKIHNLKIIEGDITEPDLELEKKSRDALLEVDEFFHSAAITEINRLLGEVRKTNVEGTENVLDLALNCSRKGNLKKVNHLSTAYICGDYKDVFTEMDLDVGQRFNSTYEQSKFEAEKLVEKFRKKNLWIDIFRPPIVIGESDAGKIFRFRNVYNFIHLCELEIFDTLPILDSHVNLVPVDTLAKAIYTISAHTEERNKNFHPFSQEPISLKAVLDMTGSAIGFKKPKMVLREQFDMRKTTPAQRAILRNSIFSVNLRAGFDTTFTKAILKNYGFDMPEIDNETFLKILTYYAKEKYANQIGIK